MFGKINPDLPKIWFVSSSKKLRKIASTEFIPLKGAKSNSKFLYYMAWSEFLYGKCKSFVSGTTPSRERVDPKSFLKISIPLPPIEEQQKIALILSDVDKLIQSYSNSVESTKKLKDGLMTSLFTKGIGHKKFKKLQIIPRFIDFIIPEEWDVTVLDKISIEIKDGPMGFALHNYDYVEKGIPLLRIKNLQNLTITKDDLRFISKEKHEELKKSQVKPLDIVISKTGVLGMIGIMPQNYGPANLNQALARITLKNKKIIHYVASFLSTTIPQQILSVVGSGRTVQAGLKLSDIKNLQIPIPPFEEQQKIASILSKIDEKISDLESKKSKLENLKKGLMQKLLTGQIRVKI